MNRKFTIFLTICLVALLSVPAMATNGDNLIAIGPIARSMGGVGVANPQDAISAVFANPAAMCFGRYCPASEFDFAATLFMPKIDAMVNRNGTIISGDADDNIFMIPAMGVSIPLSESSPYWRLGVAAYGVSGLGVDYRDTNINQRSYALYGGFPLIGGEYTSLQIMKFAPSIAFQPNDNWSFGLAVHVDYGILDLRNDESSGYGIGVQVGAIYKPTDNWSLGMSYVSPQSIDHDKAYDFDGNGSFDTLELEAPQTLSAGVAYEMGTQFLVEVDVKWINWEDAAGYADFDWEDQWVFAIGAQYRLNSQFTLRAGYNFGNNPVREHDNFVGVPAPGPGLTTVQGKTLPTYYYETFRIIGFPAIVEQHLTVGLGYDFSPTIALHFSYMHAFEETISESGTDLTGQPVTLESSLSENSVEFGLTWRF